MAQSQDDDVLGEVQFFLSGAVGEVLGASGAVPVLDVTGLIAGSLLSFDLFDTLVAQSQDDDVLGEVQFFPSGAVGVVLGASGAVPVLTVTGLIAGSGLSLYLFDALMAHSQDGQLFVGQLSSFGAAAVELGITFGAVVVTVDTIFGAGSGNCCSISSANMASGQDHQSLSFQCRAVGVVYQLAVRASPVFNVTGGGVGSGDSGGVHSTGMLAGVAGIYRRLGSHIVAIVTAQNHPSGSGMGFALGDSRPGRAGGVGPLRIIGSEPGVVLTVVIDEGPQVFRQGIAAAGTLHSLGISLQRRLEFVAMGGGITALNAQCTVGAEEGSDIEAGAIGQIHIQQGAVQAIEMIEAFGILHSGMGLGDVNACQRGIVDQRGIGGVLVFPNVVSNLNNTSGFTGLFDGEGYVGIIRGDTNHSTVADLFDLVINRGGGAVGVADKEGASTPITDRCAFTDGEGVNADFSGGESVQGIVCVAQQSQLMGANGQLTFGKLVLRLWLFRIQNSGGEGQL